MNYVVYGEEQYQVKKAIQSILQKELGAQDDMSTISYNALDTSIDVILEDAQTIPFFTEKKGILIQNANFLSSNNDTDIALDKLEAYLTKPMDSTVLIMSGAFPKMDMRKKMVKKIASLCKVTVCNKLDKHHLPVYVKEEVNKRHIKMEEAVFKKLCDQFPYDIGVIQSELDKLELYGGSIDAKTLTYLTTRTLEDDVFALVNAVVEKNVKKMFSIWNDLQVLNKDPIYLIALIASQFHLLFQVKCAMIKGMHDQNEIASDLGVHPYRVKLALPVCARLSIDTIMELLHRLADLDQSIKSGKLDKKLGFELFLLKLKGCMS